jgi:hypothetical protein
LGTQSGEYIKELEKGVNGVPEEWLETPGHAVHFLTILYDDYLAASS